MNVVDRQIWYTCGYKYQLVKPYTTYTAIRPKSLIKTDYITLTLDGFLTAVKGYAWDGPSGPTVDDGTNMRASIAHDMKYQLMRLRLLPESDRITADKELREDLDEDGMGYLRRQQWYWALRFAGESSANPKSARTVCVSPRIVYS